MRRAEICKFRLSDIGDVSQRQRQCKESGSV